MSELTTTGYRPFPKLKPKTPPGAPGAPATPPGNPYYSVGNYTSSGQLNDLINFDPFQGQMVGPPAPIGGYQPGQLPPGGLGTLPPGQSYPQPGAFPPPGAENAFGPPASGQVAFNNYIGGLLSDAGNQAKTVNEMIDKMPPKPPPPPPKK